MSSIGKKFAYLRDRVVNAWWMIREGRFRLIFKSIAIELGHRWDAIENWYKANRPIPESAIPQSCFVNKRKVIPPSYRPTGAVLLPGQDLQVDRARISARLQQLRDGIELADGVEK